MITTAILNNAKPARGVNWCGNPMKEGEDYWGNPASHEATQDFQDAPPSPVEAPTSRPDSPAVSGQRKRNTKRTASWTAEKRKLFSDRMKAWHKRRALDSQSSAAHTQTPSVSTDST